jgi:hypothetical protein
MRDQAIVAVASTRPCAVQCYNQNEGVRAPALLKPIGKADKAAPEQTGANGKSWR